MGSGTSTSSGQPLVVYAKKAGLYFAGGCAVIAGLGAWALLAAPGGNALGRAVGVGFVLLFLSCAVWIVLATRGPLLELSHSGLTYRSHRGLFARTEQRFVASDAIAHVSFRAVHRGGTRMVITQRSEAHGGLVPPDLRINLGFLDITKGTLVDRMNELARAKGVILH